MNLTKIQKKPNQEEVTNFLKEYLLLQLTVVVVDIMLAFNIFVKLENI
jgi:hypothetical protein